MEMAIEDFACDSKSLVKARIVPNIFKRKSSIAHVSQPKEICLRIWLRNIAQDFDEGPVHEHRHYASSALIATGVLFHHSHTEISPIAALGVEYPCSSTAHCVHRFLHFIGSLISPHTPSVNIGKGHAQQPYYANPFSAVIGRNECGPVSLPLVRRERRGNGWFATEPASRTSGRGTLDEFRMDLCGLIVSMEQTEISPRPAIGAIVVVSGLAVSFLLWLLYVHHASADFAGRWMFLPALNAFLNGMCAIALCVGLYFIKHRDREAHRTSMLLAFAFSSIFLVSYIVNHAIHGDSIFPGHGPVRTLYLSILASHVILSIVALPMILTTFFFSLTGRFAMHRRIARLTFPIWLYVSITGVVVFVFLKTYAY